nr:hypothetical protein [Flavobacteriales bacterium]
NVVGQKKENDLIDNHQLYQAYKGYIDYFITEDKGIHCKATKVNLQNKVLFIADAIKLLNEKFSLIIPQHPLLWECSTREIENEINDIFFDSFRDSYDGFNEWFFKCARENRRCYILKVESKISALLIFHREKSNDHNIENIKEDALKMCTLKVAETVFGYRLGELFLNKMLTLCINGNINYLYLTVFPHHIHLIDLLSKYGFIRSEFRNKHGLTELRMIKSLVKSDYLTDPQAISSHPFYFDDETINKFVIPIAPKFYDTLFKDGRYRARTLFDDTETSLNEIEGNTISKAYLCKSKRLNMKQGDLLFFYGSKTIKNIEPVGILDSITYTNDIDEIKNLVKRKTVYSETQLEELASGKNKVTVMVFRLLYYLNNTVNHKEIKTLESYSNNFQTITTLLESDYNYLKQKKHFNEHYIIN